MKMTIFHVKLIHTVIFWLLSACVLYVLFSGLGDHITRGRGSRLDWWLSRASFWQPLAGRVR